METRFMRTLIGIGLAVALVAGESPPGAAAQEVATADRSRVPAETPDPYFSEMYRSFFTGYRLGQGDELAIHVQGEPEYSLDKVRVSPMGSLYHPLIGELSVAGYTLRQLEERLTGEFGEYLVKPKVHVMLLEATSAKIGVIGDVVRPGIFVLAKPTTILEAIEGAGGFTDFGSKSNVTLISQEPDGRMRTATVNVKRILEGKAAPEENLRLHAGDTVLVRGNTRKKIAFVASLAGFAGFVAFLQIRNTTTPQPKQ